MKNISLITLVLLSAVLFNCKNSKEVADKTVDYKALATEKLGEKVAFIPNEDNSMVLCSSQQSSPKLGPSGVKFFVFDNNSNTIVYEENIGRGTVAWYSNTQLEMYYTPGTMRQDQTRDDFISVYDLIKKEKIEKTELVKQEKI